MIVFELKSDVRFQRRQSTQAHLMQRAGAQPRAADGKKTLP